MKLHLKFTCIALFLMTLSFQSIAAIVTPSTVVKEEVIKQKKEKKESVFTQLTIEEIFTMPKKDIEEKVGRKLKFKEKIALKIIQKAAKKATKKIAKKKAKAGANEDLFGILSVTFGSLAFLGMISTFGGGAFGFGAGILFGIAGIALGIIGLKREEPKKVLSILGIVFGSIALLFSLLIFVIVLSILAA